MYNTEHQMGLLTLILHDVPAPSAIFHIRMFNVSPLDPQQETSYESISPRGLQDRRDRRPPRPPLGISQAFRKTLPEGSRVATAQTTDMSVYRVF